MHSASDPTSPTNTPRAEVAGRAEPTPGAEVAGAESTPRAEVAPRAEFNPLKPAYRDNPYPFLHQRRKEDPVHWSSVFQCWVITRYVDVMAALRDPRLGSDIRNWSRYERYYNRPELQGLRPPSDLFRYWLILLDGPDHTRLRALVTKALTPRIVEQMRSRIGEIIQRQLDLHADRGTMDIVANLAYPLPVKVICDMLGIPDADFSRVIGWTADLAPGFEATLSLEKLKKTSVAMTEFKAFVRDLIAARRAGETPILIDTMIAACEGESLLSREELVGTIIFLFVAGHITTVQLLASGVLLLLTEPSLAATLRANPALIAPAVEEMMRLESPLAFPGRAAREDLEIGGKRIKKGQLVLLSVAAANRDPAQFPDPDRFDLTRVNNRHLAFGYGGHFCSGAALARLEVQTAIGALVSRFPHMRLAPGRIARRSTTVVRSIDSLPVHLDARTAAERGETADTANGADTPEGGP